MKSTTSTSTCQDGEFKDGKPISQPTVQNGSSGSPTSTSLNAQALEFLPAMFSPPVPSMDSPLLPSMTSSLLLSMASPPLTNLSTPSPQQATRGLSALLGLPTRVSSTTIIPAPTLCEHNGRVPAAQPRVRHRVLDAALAGLAIRSARDRTRRIERQLYRQRTFTAPILNCFQDENIWTIMPDMDNVPAYHYQERVEYTSPSDYGLTDTVSESQDEFDDDESFCTNEWADDDDVPELDLETTSPLPITAATSPEINTSTSTIGLAGPSTFAPIPAMPEEEYGQIDLEMEMNMQSIDRWIDGVLTDPPMPESALALTRPRTLDIIASILSIVSARLQAERQIASQSCGSMTNGKEN